MAVQPALTASGRPYPSAFLRLNRPLGGTASPRAASTPNSSFNLAHTRAIRSGVHEITVILNRINEGDSLAADELMNLVYDDLRKLAAAKMFNEAPGQTLQATALMHEAWLRLGGDQQPEWQNRPHFFAAAAEAMRRILIDRARSRHAVRHGGGLVRLNVDDLELAAAADDDRVLAINDALEKLALVDPPKAVLVKLRYFAGLTLEEAARTLEISEPTAKRWWAYARAWLFQKIREAQV